MKIEFFHDVVCGWCYIQSPALRKLNERYGVEVVHRSFVLQRNDREMINRWGSLEGAKNQILQHWESCAEFEGSYERFNISGMREASLTIQTDSWQPKQPRQRKSFEAKIRTGTCLIFSKSITSDTPKTLAKNQ